MVSESPKQHIKAYFDGACAPFNPGGYMGMGMFVDHNVYEKKWFEWKGKHFSNSNNVAEYLAFIGILKHLEGVKGEVIKIHGDSLLVVNQMIGEWKIKDGRYLEHALLAKELYTRLSKKNIVILKWIPRLKNVIADDLSNQGLQAAHQEYLNNYQSKSKTNE